MLRCTAAFLTVVFAGALSGMQPDDDAPEKTAQSQSLEVGEPAVDFTATGIDGKPVRLSEKLKDGKHIVLVFSRAHW